MNSKIVNLVLVIFSIQINSAQRISVEKSIYGIQIGVSGIWISNESQLTDKISFRSEIGFEKGVFTKNITSVNGAGFTPVIMIEPRFYYNLNKRIENRKKTSNNSGNFIGFNIRYNHDWFYKSYYERLATISSISFIPKWGIKRPIGNHFTFEAGIGVGGYFIIEDYEIDNNIALDLHLRFGYLFK